MQQLVLAFLLFVFSLSATDDNRVLYLMQKGHLSKAIDLYYNSLQDGMHNLELTEKMAMILLDQGAKSQDPDICLLTLLGAGVSGSESVQYILENGMKSCDPNMQHTAMSILAGVSNKEAERAILSAMTSNFLQIRLEAIQILASQQHCHASGQLIALMEKVPPEILIYFPTLLAKCGDKESIRALKRLMIHPLTEVRCEAILAAGGFGRDDLVDDIGKLLKQHIPQQQEAAIVALGLLKNDAYRQEIEALTGSSVDSVQIAAYQTLNLLGSSNAKDALEKLALKANPFAIYALGNIPGTDSILTSLLYHPSTQIRINSAIALADRQNSEGYKLLGHILGQKEFLLPITTIGGGLQAWKIAPNAAQECFEDQMEELSFNAKITLLEKLAQFPDDIFCKIAAQIFDQNQTALVAPTVSLLASINTEKTIELLKIYREKIGAPYIRACCNLALFRLQKQGPYKEELYRWIRSYQYHDLIQFSPSILSKPEFQSRFRPYLTKQDASTLLLESFESLIQTKDENTIDLLLHAIVHGNRKNRYALAGLMIRASQ